MNAWVDLPSLLHGTACHVVVATALTLVAAAVARWMRRPALTHGLAVLALLALVTPPIFPVPILPAPASRPEAPAADLDTTKLDATALAAWLANPAPEPVMSSRTTLPDTAGADAGLELTSLLLGAWLLGSLAVLGSIALRGRRFGRLLRHARAPSVGLAAEVRRLASQLGLRRTPEIAVVAARVSPMLWPAATKLVLVLPEPLLRQLTPDQRATLLLHELAHVRRGDHWVRRLETLVAVLFWWLPTVWWLRSCLRHAEEQCCDAWVVWALPESERAYADALLTTVDFLSGARFVLPPQASGAGHVHHLKERLTMIMEATTPRRLSTASRLAVVAFAAVLLPVLPTQAQEKEKKSSDPELHQALERIEELEQAVKKMMADRGDTMAEALKRVREVDVDREEVEKRVKEALDSALKASENWRHLSKSEAFENFAKAGEWLEKGDFEAAMKKYRKAAELMNEGKLEAAQETYRKAMENFAVRVDDEKIRAAVEKALKAAKVGESFKNWEPLVKNLDTWRRANPGQWTKSAEQWKEFAEKWRNGEHAGTLQWYLERQRGDGDEEKADESESDERELGGRDRRIEELQDQINALQKQLKKLNGELRRLQRRDA